MATINEMRAQADRDLALGELRKQETETAAKLERLKAKIATLDESDHLARVGHRPVAEWTTREKTEYVVRYGFRGFADLLGVR